MIHVIIHGRYSGFIQTIIGAYFDIDEAETEFNRLWDERTNSDDYWHLDSVPMN